MPKTILVVDDSPTVRQQVGVALSQAGFQIIEAADGVEGADKAKRFAEIALVISDVNMPHMNGIEMLEQIRADGKTAKLPVIMLTTERQPRLLERAKVLGAVGWIVKPFKAESLVAAAKKITAGPLCASSTQGPFVPCRGCPRPPAARAPKAINPPALSSRWRRGWRAVASASST